MRISTKYGFAFLCMTKTASTSVENALTPHSELLTQGKYATALKHINYRKYSKYIEPLVKNTTGIKPETVCVMREPIDWLHSWYRYRKRDEISTSERSTKDLSFNEFCELYLERKAKVGRQINFVKDHNGKIGVDKIFRYEKLELLKEYFEEKIGKPVDFPVMNVSPKESMDIDADLKSKLMEFLEEDYSLYLSLD